MTSLPEYALLSFTSVFAILDPIAVIPGFLAMTANQTAAERNRTAKLACFVSALCLIVFAVSGKWVFKLLGISLPAFQIAGSLVLLSVAFDMLRGKQSAVKGTQEEEQAGIEKDDIAITPLAVPMMAGPGALSTTLMLHHQAPTFMHQMSLYICIMLVCLLSYVVFRVAVHSARWLSPIVLKIVTRIMGLLLAAVAIQFAVNAINTLRNS